MQDAIALLERTPSALDALLRGLPERWTHRAEGPGTWTVFGVMGHLIHGEKTDWMPRVKTILQSGEMRTFEPFDRVAQERAGEASTLPQLLDLFARLRRTNLQELVHLNLQTSDLDRRGRHPALGVVTLRQLISTWTVHDLTHLHQVSRVMAHQYREAVGPWSAYLGVLHCTGHSSS